MTGKDFEKKLSSMMFDEKTQKDIQKVSTLHLPEVYLDGEGIITNKHWLVNIYDHYYQELPDHLSWKGIAVPMHKPAVLRMSVSKIITGKQAVKILPEMRKLYHDTCASHTKDAYFGKEDRIQYSFQGKTRTTDVYQVNVSMTSGRVKKEIYRKVYIDQILDLLKLHNGAVNISLRHSGIIGDGVLIIGGAASVILMPARRP